MTTTLSEKGQVVIPRDVRARLGLRAGDDFLVLSSEGEDILLRPVRRKRRGSWVASLRALRGLELKRADEPIRDVAL